MSFFRGQSRLGPGGALQRDPPGLEANFDAYGLRKLWRPMKREGIDVARCTVASLMRRMGLKGVVRCNPVKTTISDKATPCPLDQVNRQFQAPQPNAL